MSEQLGEKNAVAERAARGLDDELRQALQRYLPRYESARAAVLPALHIVHEKLGFVSPKAIEDIAELLGLAPGEVHDTMSFYQFFHTPECPLGEHRVFVCRSIACSLRGGENLLDYLCRRLGIAPGQTTPDGKVTVEFAECLGACDFAPSMLIDGVLHKDMTREKIDELIDSWGVQTAEQPAQEGEATAEP